MKIDDVMAALERVREEFGLMAVEAKNAEIANTEERRAGMFHFTKGGYFRVGNVAIKIAEITELKP